MIHVHLSYPPAPEDLAVLRGQLHSEVQLTVGDLPDPAQFEILVNGRPTPTDLSASPNLHTVIIPWAGVPEVTAQRLRDFPHIKLHNLHHNAAIVAEGMLMLLLGVARQAMPADRALRQGDWRPRYERPFTAQLLHGKKCPHPWLRRDWAAAGSPVPWLGHERARHPPLLKITNY